MRSTTFREGSSRWWSVRPALAAAAACGTLLAGGSALAQHASGYESPTYAGSPGGTVITGQDGFYIPVPDSQEGLVYTYVGNALGLPQNPTGQDQFVGLTGGDTALPVPFARAQRDVVYGAGTGVWTVSFDVAALYLGVLPSAQNIGSFSTQLFAAPNPSQQTFICLARWTDPATAAAWNADYVWFDAAGTQLTEQVPDPGFQGLLTSHWYRWCTEFDLDTNAITAVSITDLTTGVSVTHNPVGRYMFGGTTGSATGPPSGFRYFGGTNVAGAAGNTLAFDNLDIADGEGVCVPEVQCLWDLDGSGSVGIVDLLALLAAWGSDPGGPPDFDGSGSVGIGDLLKLLANWGPCCVGLSSVAADIIPLTGMDISLDNIAFHAVATAGNVAALREEVLNEWHYPEATVDGCSIEVVAVHRVGDQGFSEAELAEHRSFLESGTRSLQPGYTVHALTWTLIDPGHGSFNFTTLGYEDEIGCAVMEPFLFMIPLQGESPLAGCNYIGVSRPGAAHAVEFKVDWAIGQANGHGDMVLMCNGNNVANCQGLVGHNASFLSEAQTTKEPPAIFQVGQQQCCSIVFHFGFANGFKGLEVGVDGFSISITGSLGYSGSKEWKVCKCCPNSTPCP